MEKTNDQWLWFVDNELVDALAYVWPLLEVVAGDGHLASNLGVSPAVAFVGFLFPLVVTLLLGYVLVARSWQLATWLYPAGIAVNPEAVSLQQCQSVFLSLIGVLFMVRTIPKIVAKLSEGCLRNYGAEPGLWRPLDIPNLIGDVVQLVLAGGLFFGAHRLAAWWHVLPGEDLAQALRRVGWWALWLAMVVATILMLRAYRTP